MVLKDNWKSSFIFQTPYLQIHVIQYYTTYTALDNVYQQNYEFKAKIFYRGELC